MATKHDDVVVRCVLDLRHVPAEVFRLPNDGRKWRKNCFNRRALVMQMATYADPDGSNIWVSADTLADDIGISRRAVNYLLDELLALEFIENHGYRVVGTKHTRIRSLMVDRMLDAAKCSVQDSPASTVQDSKGSVQDTPSSVQDSPEQCARFEGQCATYEGETLQSCTQPPLTVPLTAQSTAHLPARQEESQTGQAGEAGCVKDIQTPPQRWRAFKRANAGNLPESLQGAEPDDDERQELLGLLDKLAAVGFGADEFCDAVTDVEDNQSPPLHTLVFHRWTRILDSGLAAAINEKVAYMREKQEQQEWENTFARLKGHARAKEFAAWMNNNHFATWAEVLKIKRRGYTYRETDLDFLRNFAGMFERWLTTAEAA
jgi:biotin operon repressor